MSEKWYVEVVETKTDEVVERLGPMPENKACKVQGGLDINLNHQEFHTSLVCEFRKERETETDD